MCVGMLSIFALTFLVLNGWAGFKLGRVMCENKSTVARTAFGIYNLPEIAYQTCETRQKNINKKLHKNCSVGAV